jgi:hypothetical protein
LLADYLTPDHNLLFFLKLHHPQLRLPTLTRERYCATFTTITTLTAFATTFTTTDDLGVQRVQYCIS